MANHSSVAERFVSYWKGDSTRLLRGKNVFPSSDGRDLYSYGSHFSLVHVVEGEQGRARLFLLNGDTYSVTTNRHQSLVRDVCQGSGVPTIIVPFSALDAAGIDMDSLEPIEVTADTHERIERSSASLADVPKHERKEYMETGRMILAGGYVYENGVTRWDADKEQPERVLRDKEPDADGLYHWTAYVHHLGASTFLATVSEWISVTDGNGTNGQRYRIQRENVPFLSAFDEQERRPLYFLCELPRIPANVKDALEILKPTEVIRAEQEGKTVTRQGDVFGIPTDWTTQGLKERGARFRRRSGVAKLREQWNAGLIPWDDYHASMDTQLLETNHEATYVAELDGIVYARGCLYHNPGSWREPDHARRKLGDGKTWHRIVRNAVPVSSSVTARGHARAWTISGRVD
jgi:hypothetical protein